jgi:uncharacterized Zn-finger protein
VERKTGDPKSFSGQLRIRTHSSTFGAIQPAETCTDDIPVSDCGNIGLNGQKVTTDEVEPIAPLSQPCLQILGKKSFLCIYNKCGSQFTRISDLKRHHLDRHVHIKSFYCRFNGCRRAKRGYARKDKRDDHEKRIHRGGELDDEGALESEGAPGK